ncbi:hypothetical protein [Kaarinaea lacus]
MAAKGTDIIHQEGTITIGERFTRALLAISMLFYPMLSSALQMDWIAMLPLVAIYPMFTAIVGWDPILFLVESGEHAGKSSQVRTVARLVLISVGALMIVAALIIPAGYIGWYSLLALFGAIPVFIAILGENPVLALHDSIVDLRDINKNKVEQTVVIRRAAGLDESAGKSFIVNQISQAHKRAA